VTTVLIADDHGLVRSGLRRILQHGGVEVVGEAASGEEALARASETRPDVVLMDISMPGMNGLEAVSLLKRAHPEMAVIILTVEDDVAYLERSFDAGAAGYVLKDAADEELLAAIREVASSGRYVHPTMGARLVDRRPRPEPQPGPPAGPGGALTEREIEVLRELAHGRTNAEVAQRLFVSVRTVEAHRMHIQQKLGVRSRAELVERAIQAGLITRTRPGAEL